MGLSLSGMSKLNCIVYGNYLVRNIVELQSDKVGEQSTNIACNTAFFIFNYVGVMCILLYSCYCIIIQNILFCLNFRSFLGVYFLLPVTGSFLSISKYFSKCTKTSTSLEGSLIINCESVIDNESVVHFEREECEDDQYDLIEYHAVEEMKCTKNFKISKFLKLVICNFIYSLLLLSYEYNSKLYILFYICKL